jgi:hypothetical protein
VPISLWQSATEEEKMSTVRLLCMSLLALLVLGCDILSESAVRDNPSDAGATTVAAPVFDLPGRNHGAPQSVTMTTTPPGASIRYTTDGSTPTSPNGTVYQGALTVSQATTFKAMAYKDGLADSSVTTATYTFATLTDEEAVAADREATAIGYARIDSAPSRPR